MLPLRIENETRYLGPPPDLDPAGSTKCVGLSIRDVVVDGIHYMVSRYEITPDELERLKAGKPVELWIAGRQHPMVALTVPDE